jgi:ATP-dependent Lon protease
LRLPFIEADGRVNYEIIGERWVKVTETVFNNGAAYASKYEYVSAEPPLSPETARDVQSTMNKIMECGHFGAIDVMLHPGQFALYADSVIAELFEASEQFQIHQSTSFKDKLTAIDKKLYEMRMEIMYAKKMSEEGGDTDMETPVVTPGKEGREKFEFKTTVDTIKAFAIKFEEMQNRFNDNAYAEIGTALQSMCGMSITSSDYGTLKRFVEYSLRLPWGAMSSENADIKDIKAAMDKSNYGMKHAKERVIESIAIKVLNPEGHSPVFLMTGSPGTGKTSLALSVAAALGRPCHRISCGGFSDSSSIVGHRRTYSGATAGRIMEAMTLSKVDNPVIILDEVDKMSSFGQGDPNGALLEALDENQNKSFTDHYLGYGYDLSKAMFIVTANNPDRIMPALYDRCELIEIEGYKNEEKIAIAKNYSIPKGLKKTGLEAKQVKIPAKVLERLVLDYNMGPGLRRLDQDVENLVRYAAMEIVSNKRKSVTITEKIMHERLGVGYTEIRPLEHDRPGICSGLYVSGSDGGVLSFEAVILSDEGEGGVRLTGMTQDVMNESCRIAHSYVQSHAYHYGVNGADLDEMDIHIHIPDGSTPKDGPSAGLAFATLIMSLLSDTPVKKGLAMTGEISLTGKALPIGGADKKCAGALRMGMTDVILPEANRKNYDDFKPELKSALTYHFVKDISEVFEIAFGFGYATDAELEALKAEMAVKETE